MTFNEVESLYHEMGHGLQHMLTRVEDGDAAGISGVEWDAVELPSQFMENWLLDKPTLYSFAKHYETGAPLPDEFYDKLKGAKTFQAGLGMSRQIAFGQLDVELHARYDPACSETLQPPRPGRSSRKASGPSEAPMSPRESFKFRGRAFSSKQADGRLWPILLR